MCFWKILLYILPTMWACKVMTFMLLKVTFAMSMFSFFVHLFVCFTLVHLSYQGCSKYISAAVNICKKHFETFNILQYVLLYFFFFIFPPEWTRWHLHVWSKIVARHWFWEQMQSDLWPCNQPIKSRRITSCETTTPSRLW